MTSPASRLYLLLFVIGTLFPGYHFLLFLTRNGIDMQQVWEQITANSLGRFAWADVVVSAATVLVLLRYDGDAHHVPRRWLAVLFLFIIGVSAGLPLYLYLRERHLEKAASAR